MMLTEGQRLRVAENKPLYIGSFSLPTKAGERCGIGHCGYVPLVWEFDVAGYGRVSLVQGESATFIANEQLEWVRRDPPRFAFVNQARLSGNSRANLC